MTAVGAIVAVAGLTDSPLLRRATLQLVLLGGLNGLVGVHVVTRRQPFFALTIAHGAFPGVVAASLLGVSLWWGAAAFALAIVAATVLVGTLGEVPTSSGTGVVLSGAFALGALVASTQQGYSRNLAAFLVGSVLGVTPADLWVTAGVGALVAGAVGATHKELVFAGFDRTGMEAMGYRTTVVDTFVLVVIAATVALSVPTVGVVLAVALLVTPAATARLWTDRMGATMALSSLFGAASGALGMAWSQRWGVATSGAVVLTGAALFVVSLLVAPYGMRARGARG